MNRDEILAIYDEWYADSYDGRFHADDDWNANLGGYKVEVVQELLPPDGRWLDVGCGTGKHLSALPDVRREGLDLSPSMVARARAANPDVTIHEGSYLDDHPEWTGAWDLVTNLWLSYQFVDSLKLLEQAVANMASWVSSDGAIFMHVADCEDVARGVDLPWEDPETPVFGDSLFVTSVTWTWKESNGRTHHDLVAPQLQRMVNIIARDFEEVEVRRWPAIDPESALGRPKGVIGRKKRPTPISADEVGNCYPFTLTYPPRDHPREHDPHRPEDPPRPSEAAPDESGEATRLADIERQLGELRSDISALAEALTAAAPENEEAQYDTLGVVHEQVWAVRRELADLHRAWGESLSANAADANTAASPRSFARRVRRLLSSKSPSSRSPGSGPDDGR